MTKEERQLITAFVARNFTREQIQEAKKHIQDTPVRKGTFSDWGILNDAYLGDCIGETRD